MHAPERKKIKNENQKLKGGNLPKGLDADLKDSWSKDS